MGTEIKQRIKTFVKESLVRLKLDKGRQDNNIVSMISPEILMKLFHLAYPKGASALRLVCKQWRDVYNDNYEIKAKLNDDTAPLPCFIQYRRVTECTIVNFRKEYVFEQNLHLFQDPSLLTKLTILGKITRNNFLFLAVQCTHIRELTFTGASLDTVEKLFESETLEERIALKMLLGNLRKLVITGAFSHKNNLDPGANGYTSKNLITLFGYEMPNLTTLVVRVNSSTFLVNDILGFVEKCGGLKHVEVDYRMNGAYMRDFCIRQEKVVITLSSLKIRVNSVEYLRYWLPLITTQRNLETLRLRSGNNYKYCDFSAEISEVIKKNTKLKEIQVDMLEI